MAKPGRARKRKLVLVADDYGLSPGVSKAIRELILAGRLSGTGCMTLFPEWPSEAPALKTICNEGVAEAGLHLTLTDFEPLSGSGPLGAGSMPPLGRLIRASVTSRIDEAAVEGELDAQLEAFRKEMGSFPHYIDGHQHVHFLPVVRGWLEKRAKQFSLAGQMPWLRGAPSVMAAQGLKMRAKVAIVAAMARGFERDMKAHGYHVKGPLLGFYDWNNPEAFKPMLDHLSQTQIDFGVLMCHPGFPDDMLRSRDRLIEARAVEFDMLMKNGLDAEDIA
jgi:chitin disaccharide deacetylase